MPHDHAFFRFLRQLLLSVSLLFALPGWVLAAPSTSTINQAIEQQRQVLEQTQHAQSALRQQLAATQKALAASESARDDLADERDQLQMQQAALQAQAATIDARMRTQKQHIDEGLRLAYTLGNQHPLSTLIDPDHALDDARFLHYIRQILTQTTEQMAALRTDQQAGAANQQSLVKATQKLDATETQLTAQLARHRQAQAEQNRLLSQLSAQADSQSQALAALLEKKKALDDEIKRLNTAAEQKAKTEAANPATRPAATTQASRPQALTDAEARARAPTPNDLPANPSASGIPIGGKILRAYGAEIANGDMRAQGISFAAPVGSPVRAVEAGRVIFADSMKGWGDLVILKHPGGYLSLYAHNSALSVRTGQRVGAGAVIARSGTLNAHESGLYFEVRRGNDTVNPARWSSYRQVRR